MVEILSNLEILLKLKNISYDYMFKSESFNKINNLINKYNDVINKNQLILLKINKIYIHFIINKCFLYIDLNNYNNDINNILLNNIEYIIINYNEYMINKKYLKTFITNIINYI